MKRSHLRNSLSLAIPLFSAFLLQAQADFAYSSELERVPEAGFYKIVLQPAIVAKCRESLQDIRILDQQSRQVPYILQTGKVFLQIAPVTIHQHDSSDQSSYIDIRLNDDYLVNRIEIVIEGTRFYKRTASVSSGSTWVTALSIRSGVPAIFQTHIKTRHLRLVIQNGDSPPLQVSAVKLWQAEKFLLSYLEGMTYSLAFGNAAISKPNYDLTFFKDSIKGTARPLATGPLIQLASSAAAAQLPEKKSNHALLLWSIIGGVLLLLLVLTLKMTREVNRKRGDREIE